MAHNIVDVAVCDSPHEDLAAIAARHDLKFHRQIDDTELVLPDHQSCFPNQNQSSHLSLLIAHIERPLLAAENQLFLEPADH